MKNLAVYFAGVRRIEVREEDIPVTHEHQVLVQTISSAISSGTEMLFYQGLVPEEIPIDENIPVLAKRGGYPFKYGYSAVGKVIGCGKAVDPQWMGKTVFAYHPHQSYFTAEPDNLIDIAGLQVDDAVFLANMETAVNFLMDGRPMVGERVMVFGQGVVGLLTTMLLSQIPLRKIITVELLENRRKQSIDAGAHACLDPTQTAFLGTAKQLFEGDGADLVYEITGNPQALEQAIPLTSFGGRIIIGSWYGEKKAKTILSSHFHRSRITLMSSQVSTLAPEFRGAWTKQRRLDFAQEMLRNAKPARLITHRIPISEAAQAYRLIEQRPDETLGVVLTY